MGYDMHGVFQAKQNSKWIDIDEEWDFARDYHLYSWLGMGGWIPPICKPRGIPCDFQKKEHHLLGEWGFSWLLASEIIESGPPSQKMTIWIPINTYSTWDKTSNPAIWHELHSDWQKHEDAEHYATPESINEETWQVIIEWNYDFASDFASFLDKLQRLMDRHGEVRLVFGFNS